MPGTPILYYGDEIGMGDNYYLGDRDGVRTPMQWSADRNAGFSAAPIRKSSICRRSSTRSMAIRRPMSRCRRAMPSSLLNWMRRMIAVRKQHAVFGRGHDDAALSAQPQDPRLHCASTRATTVLCVANLSDTAQAVELAAQPAGAACRSGRTHRARGLPAGGRPALYADAAGLRLFLVYLLSRRGFRAPSWHEEHARHPAGVHHHDRAATGVSRPR